MSRFIFIILYIILCRAETSFIQLLLFFKVQIQKQQNTLSTGEKHTQKVWDKKFLSDKWAVGLFAALHAYT